MIDIAKKKLPMPVIGVLVYLSYCAAYWYAARGNLAYYASQARFGNIDFGVFLANDACAFFIGGIMPGLLYLLYCSFVYRSLHLHTGGDVMSLRYGVDLTVIAANVVLFLFKFVYLAIPLYAPVVNIIVDPLVTLAFLWLYMLYAFHREYVPKPRFRFALSMIMTPFLVFYGAMAFINIILIVS